MVVTRLLTGLHRAGRVIELRKPPNRAYEMTARLMAVAGAHAHILARRRNALICWRSCRWHATAPRTGTTCMRSTSAALAFFANALRAGRQ